MSPGKAPDRICESCEHGHMPDHGQPCGPCLKAHREYVKSTPAVFIDQADRRYAPNWTPRKEAPIE